MCIGAKNKQGVEDFVFIIVGQKIGMSFLEFLGFVCIRIHEVVGTGK
jgi:hypothetical protein